MDNQRRLSVIGATGAGKTTYAGRLWLAFQKRDSRVTSRGLPEALAPFKDASQPLLDDRYPHHTTMGHLASLHAPLSWRSQQQELPFQLSFTDYSGEELEAIFNRLNAAWSQHWVEQAEDSTGVLLLVRANQILRPHSDRLALPPGEEGDRLRLEALHKETPEPPKTPLGIDEPADLFGEAFLPSDAPNPERNPSLHERVHPPTEVALVEVLQFFRHERGLWMGEIPDPNTFRVAIGISCWDAVPNNWKYKGPAPFLRRHFPLLNEFLGSNFDPNGVSVFGISSTGGDLKDESFRLKYKESEPDEMGEVVYHPSRDGLPKTSPDLTLPIGWLLEGDAVFLPV